MIRREMHAMYLLCHIIITRFVGAIRNMKAHQKPIKLMTFHQKKGFMILTWLYRNFTSYKPKKSKDLLTEWILKTETWSNKQFISGLYWIILVFQSFLMDTFRDRHVDIYFSIVTEVFHSKPFLWCLSNLRILQFIIR